MTPTPPRAAASRQVRLHVTACLAFLLVFGWVGLIVGGVILYRMQGYLPLPLAAGGICLMAILHLSYLMVSAGVRCVVCGQPNFRIPSGKHPHPHAKRFLGLSYDLQVSRDVLLSQSYHCIHCNSVCRSRRKLGNNHSVKDAGMSRSRREGEEAAIISNLESAPSRPGSFPGQNDPRIGGSPFTFVGPAPAPPHHATQVSTPFSDIYTSPSQLHPSPESRGFTQVDIQPLGTPPSPDFIHSMNTNKSDRHSPKQPSPGIQERPPWAHHGNLSPFVPETISQTSFDQPTTTNMESTTIKPNRSNLPSMEAPPPAGGIPRVLSSLMQAHDVASQAEPRHAEAAPRVVQSAARPPAEPPVVPASPFSVLSASAHTPQQAPAVAEHPPIPHSAPNFLATMKPMPPVTPTLPQRPVGPPAERPAGVVSAPVLPSFVPSSPQASIPVAPMPPPPAITDPLPAAAAAPRAPGVEDLLATFLSALQETRKSIDASFESMANRLQTSLQSTPVTPVPAGSSVTNQPANAAILNEVLAQAFAKKKQEEAVRAAEQAALKAADVAKLQAAEEKAAREAAMRAAQQAAAEKAAQEAAMRAAQQAAAERAAQEAAMRAAQQAAAEKAAQEAAMRAAQQAAAEKAAQEAAQQAAAEKAAHEAAQQAAAEKAAHEAAQEAAAEKAAQEAAQQAAAEKAAQQAALRAAQLAEAQRVAQEAANYAAKLAAESDELLKPAASLKPFVKIDGTASISPPSPFMVVPSDPASQAGGKLAVAPIPFPGVPPGNMTAKSQSPAPVAGGIPMPPGFAAAPAPAPVPKQRSNDPASLLPSLPTPGQESPFEMISPPGASPDASQLGKAMSETVFPLDSDLDPQVPPFKFLVNDGEGFIPDGSKLPEGWKFPGV